jgi:hypothetical protein
MRKKLVSPSSTRRSTPQKRKLQVSKEVIRSLTSDDLSNVVAGCPWLSLPGTENTLQDDSGHCVK